MVKLHPIYLAQIAIIAENAIKAKPYRDFDFLLKDIEEIKKFTCKVNWDKDAEITIDETPF